MSSLEKIRITNFRNIESATLEVSPRIILLNGENAQGKTNFLEAIHLLSNLRSFRTRRVDNLICKGKTGAAIEGLIKDEWGDTTLSIKIDKKERTTLVDGKAPSSMGKYLEIFPTVFFGPQDMELARGSQGMRRRYLDRASFDRDAGHLDILRMYLRALKQRNHALRTRGSFLEPWDIELAQLGWRIQEGRRKTLEELRALIKKVHGEISGGREKIDLHIKPSAPVAEKTWEGLLDVYKKCEEEDRKNGYTRHGPHRDRLEVKMEGRELGEYASQGQQRTLALALKLALLEWVDEQRSEPTTFLLDDPGSELDRHRLGYVGEYLSNRKGSVFIASVEENDVPITGGSEIKKYRIENGTATHG